MRRALDAAGLARLEEVVVLLTSELVTNAILYAGTDIDLVASRKGGDFRVEVRDEAPRPPLRRITDASAASGRGLGLVENLASAWGVDHLPGNGKAVWFEVTS